MAVNNISSFLDDSFVQTEPHQLALRAEQSFKGVDTGGLGFVISQQEESEALLSEPNCIEVLWPFLNGEDLLADPTQLASRRIINFSNMSQSQASNYSPLLKLVFERVYPYRNTVKRKVRRDRWWLYNESCPKLYSSIAHLERVLVNVAHSKHICFTFVPSRQVFSNGINVFGTDSYAWFALLQSTIHDFWARYYGSSLETRNRYNPTNCFETYPFPSAVVTLANIGEQYYEYRKSTMVQCLEGLTVTYNRFHDPGPVSTQVQRLRELHVEMDQAVSAAYGWADLSLDHGFHETKQGIRFTISEAARREVLARLLKLNHERYAEEVAQGLHDKKRGAGSVGRGAKKTGTRGRKGKGSSEPSLFGEAE
jgi:hypothetical protein